MIITEDGKVIRTAVGPHEDLPEGPMMYRVHWRSTLTGHSGRGSPMTRGLAESFVVFGNQEFPDIHHWLDVETKPAP